jgi:hypothetical protein
MAVNGSFVASIIHQRDNAALGIARQLSLGADTPSLLACAAQRHSQTFANTGTRKAASRRHLRN